jgi:AraC-like DNA-binding protein
MIDRKDDDRLLVDLDAETRIWIDTANEPVLALGRLYPAGFRVLAHAHNKTQLWSSRSGVVVVSTAAGRWMIPPGHGLIIPAGIEHSAEMVSEVDMHSIYVDPSAAGVSAPKVVEITHPAKSLIAELLSIDPGSATTRRQRLIMDLLLEEISELPERPLGLPVPDDPRLARLCYHFLRNPTANTGIDDWAAELGMSRRSFTRLFKSEAGVSFVTWRQQACIFASLPRLAAGETVTNVALDAGYESIAAFTTMFRRMLGSSPSTYLKSRSG